MFEVQTYPVDASDGEIAAAKTAAEKFCTENGVDAAEVWVCVQANLYKSPASDADNLWMQIEAAASQEIGREVSLRYSPVVETAGA